MMKKIRLYWPGRFCKKKGLPSLTIANAIVVNKNIGLSPKKQLNATIKSNPDLMINLYITIVIGDIELITLIF